MSLEFGLVEMAQLGKVLTLGPEFSAQNHNTMLGVCLKAQCW